MSNAKVCRILLATLGLGHPERQTTMELNCRNVHAARSLLGAIPATSLPFHVSQPSSDPPFLAEVKRYNYEKSRSSTARRLVGLTTMLSFQACLQEK